VAQRPSNRKDLDGPTIRPKKRKGKKHQPEQKPGGLGYQSEKPRRSGKKKKFQIQAYLSQTTQAVVGLMVDGGVQAI